VHRVARMEVLALAATRAAALLNVAVALGTGTERDQYFDAAGALALALLLESAAVVIMAIRHGRLPAPVGAVDLATACGALVVNAALVVGADVHTWGFFAYPYTLVASCAYGLAFTRLRSVAGAAVCLALVYGVCDHWSSGQPLWNALPNGASYLGIAPVVWAVARQLRQMGVDLDEERNRGVALVRREAVLQERAKHARLLHDRVLQTLETLAGGHWIEDSWMRDQVRAEAGWVRWLVEHGPDDGDRQALGRALHALAQERVRQGLNVVVRIPPAPADDFGSVPAPVADALLAACHEALTNVVKHAGVKRATVRAALEDGHVVLTVVDQGQGFDPSQATPGVGLTHSIRGRLEDVGGDVRIDTEPGKGTCVEMRVPLMPRCPQNSGHEDR
jgi:signal transduction histidine kinase